MHGLTYLSLKFSLLFEQNKCMRLVFIVSKSKIKSKAVGQMLPSCCPSLCEKL